MNLETVDTRAALTLDRRLELEAEARSCMYVSAVMLSFRWPTKWAISAHDRP
jgi:hypothetical protein